jgi:uncharacterized membrane protein YkoI
MKTKTINQKGFIQTPKMLLAAFLALVLSAGFATAQSLNTDDANESSISQSSNAGDATEPSISFTQAMEIALATDNGALVSLDLGFKKSSPQYIAELKDETSYTVLRIDAESGEILNTRQITASSTEELHAMLNDRHHKGRKGHGRHKGYDHDDDDDDDDRNWFDWF